MSQTTEPIDRAALAVRNHKEHCFICNNMDKADVCVENRILMGVYDRVVADMMDALVEVIDG